MEVVWQFYWLEDSLTGDDVFCRMCRHFPEATMECSFVRDRYKDWKHIHEARFKHQDSKPHSFSVDTVHLKHTVQAIVIKARGNILNQLNREDMEY